MRAPNLHNVCELLSLLQLPKRANHLARHRVKAYIEVTQRTLGLRAVIPVRWDFNLAHRIRFNAHLHCILFLLSSSFLWHWRVHPSLIKLYEEPCFEVLIDTFGALDCTIWRIEVKARLLTKRFDHSLKRRETIEMSSQLSLLPKPTNASNKRR